MRRRDTSMFKVLQAIDSLGPYATNNELMAAMGGVSRDVVAGGIVNLLKSEMVVKVGWKKTRKLVITDFGCEVLADNVPQREPMRHQGQPGEVQCLSCRRPFHSEGVASNRICEPCKSNDEWKSPAAAHLTAQEAR